MRILIVGGCFTCQHNIEYARLYHQSLKNMFIDRGDLDTEISTIRYERIGMTLEKIVTFRQSNDFDLLIFHLRTEPFMRLVKLYYKYLNHHRELKHSFNVPYFNIIMPEKYDLLENRRVNCSSDTNETKIHHYLREANYYVGSLMGNMKYAFKIYERFIDEISTYCNNTNKRFLLLGPVSRPSSVFENRLSYEISNHFTKYSNSRSIDYLELIGEQTSKAQNMFFSNGQHVSQEGHDEVAQKIFNRINNPIADCRDNLYF